MDRWNADETAIPVQTGAEQTITVIPDIMGVDLAREGNDLVARAVDGSKVVVTGYFNLADPPVLIAADGSKMPQELVYILSGALEFAIDPGNGADRESDSQIDDDFEAEIDGILNGDSEGIGAALSSLASSAESPEFHLPDPPPAWRENGYRQDSGVLPEGVTGALNPSVEF